MFYPGQSRICSSSSSSECNCSLDIWRIKNSCFCSIGSSSSARSARPPSVMRMATKRLSSLARLRVTRWRRSNRSSSRVISGSRVIIRAAISLHVTPASPAPRRIRRTLYCVGEIPEGRKTSANSCSVASAARCKIEENLFFYVPERFGLLKLLKNLSCHGSDASHPWRCLSTLA